MENSSIFWPLESTIAVFVQFKVISNRWGITKAALYYLCLRSLNLLKTLLESKFNFLSLCENLISAFIQDS